MKKILLVALSILLILSVGCNTKKNTGGNGASKNPSDISSDMSSDNSSQDYDTDSTGFDSSDIVSSTDNRPSDNSGKNDNVAPEPSNDTIVSSFGELIPTVNTARLMNPINGGYDSRAETLRKNVQSSVSNLKIKGKTYYISMNGNDTNDGTTPKTAWKTIDAAVINSYLFESGDAILFERGGVYRQTATFMVNSDITFGAYGQGNKPAIYGSQKNYSDDNIWEASRKKNVWKLSFYASDVGNVIFNHGEAVGSKRTGLLSMTKNGDFYHNTEECALYLYFDKGNPANTYKSIEISSQGDIFQIYERAKNVVFDNLCIKYGGSNAISTQGSAKNITITNCEIGWIGGSLKNAAVDPELRYGSGIVFNDSAEGCYVSNNWIYQCFDSGISFQGGLTGSANKYANLKFINNLCEYNTYNLEIWDTVLSSSYANVNIDNNILRFAGFGWATQRTDEKYASNIFVGDLYDSSMVNFSISNNILDYSALRVLSWGNQLSYKGDLRLEGLIFKNNSVYQKKVKTDELFFYNNKSVSVTSRDQLLNAMKIFDVAPGEIRWS